MDESLEENCMTPFVTLTLLLALNHSSQAGTVGLSSDSTQKNFFRNLPLPVSLTLVNHVPNQGCGQKHHEEKCHSFTLDSADTNLLTASPAHPLVTLYASLRRLPLFVVSQCGRAEYPHESDYPYQVKHDSPTKLCPRRRHPHPRTFLQ